MESQCKHLIMTQNNILIKLLQIFKEFFNGTFFHIEKDPVGFDLGVMSTTPIRVDII